MLRIYIGFQATRFYCFPSARPPLPPPPHFYCFPSTTTTTFLLFSLHHHHHHISIVFLPPPPSPPHFYCFPSTTTTTTTFLLISAHHHHHRHISIVFPLPPLACPAYQRQFLLKTATPQQLHALVQVLCNLLMGHIPISEENKRVLLPYKEALLNLASPNVPFKTKKRVLVQEGSCFIEDVLAPVVSSLGFLML